MKNFEHKDKELVLKMDTEGMTPLQVRLVKNVHALLANVLTADEESEYFENSAELIRKTAELIKHSNFAVENKNMSYGTQAVEFSVDTLNESLDGDNFQNIDN